MAAEVSSPDPSRLADIGRLGFVPGADNVRVVVDDCVHYVRVVGRFASLRRPGAGGPSVSVPDAAGCVDGVEGLVVSIVLWQFVVLLSLLVPEALRRAVRRLPRTTRCRVGIVCSSRAHRWDLSRARIFHRGARRRSPGSARARRRARRRDPGRTVAAPGPRIARSSASPQTGTRLT